MFWIGFGWHASTAKLFNPVQRIHETKSNYGQNYNDQIINKGLTFTYEIKMGINPPGLVFDEIKDESSEPHPKGIKGHKKESLKYFYSVNVKTIIDGNFEE